MYILMLDTHNVDGVEFLMKQTHMYVCTFEEFILDDLHYLEYKMELN